jgi:hypothetical protein
MMSTMILRHASCGQWYHSGTYNFNVHKTFLSDYQNRDWAFGEAGGRVRNKIALV